MQDIQNLNVRKEIEYLEGLIFNQKDLNSNNFEVIQNLNN